ncbi:MAG: hypothetical protein E6R08_00880 [Nevskiaceae bacterium]|nr:MAG: hypothetical protein E6R08_00880 [Nevskiaceae bacterium]
MRRRVGDTSNVLPLFPAEQVQQVRQAQLLREHTAVDTGDSLQAISYVPSAFVQAVLPYRDQRGETVWAKTNGKVSMVITAGSRVVNTTSTDAKGRVVKGTVVQSRGLPYGSLPRLLLSWVCTEAILKRQRTVRFGDDMRDFMNRIGCLHLSGGDNGSLTRTFQQATRLFACTISLVRNNTSFDDYSLSGMPGMSIVESCDILSDCARPSDMGGSYVTLAQWFYDEIVAHGVPCDLDAIIQLRNSALALDIYAWLTWRLSFTSRPSVVKWETLHAQFGASCASIRKFRQTFRAALANVLEVYDTAKVDHESNPQGLVLIPSPTHVPPRQLRAQY